MTALIPSLWFLFLFLFFIRKRGFGISAYVALMYVITSVCAFFLFLETKRYSDESFLFATIVYCLLISISFIPVYKLDKLGPLNVININAKFVKALIIFYLFCFLFFLLLYWQDMVFRIVLGDWDDVKKSAAMGDGYTIREYGGLLKPISMTIRIFSSVSFIMIPIFFLSMNPLRLPRFYTVSAIVSSLSSFFVAILDADRSRIVIWLLIFGLCLVIFWRNLNKRLKKSIVPIVAFILFGAFFYLYTVSVSRFSESDGGTMSSIIAYAGQPYSNFCYFFDHFNNREGINTRVLFPFTHTLILKDYIGGVDLQQTMTARTGIYCGVFYSFLGLFILDSNQIGPFLFIIFYLFIWSLALKKKSTEVSLTRFLVYFFLLIIPTYGCISYMYSHWYLTFSIVVILLLSKWSEKKVNKIKTTIN